MRTQPTALEALFLKIELTEDLAKSGASKCMGGKLFLGALGTRAALDLHVNGHRARNTRASLGSKTVCCRKDRHHIVYPTQM